jgi:D-alanyl-D-alanine carboxypeptidase
MLFNKILHLTTHCVKEHDKTMKTLHFLALAALLATATHETELCGVCEAEDCATHDCVVEAVPPPPLPSYNAGSVVVMCAETGMVLYGSEYNTQFYPASITKIMTALVVLDHVQDLEERLGFSHHAVFSIPRNSSHISMDVGETLTVNQALHALLVRSANEVAIALAEYVAESEAEFVSLMNHRAAGIGANHTHFVNPTGLPAPGHVTTAYDMALIMREAVRQYPVFSDIIATRQFAIPPTERQPETRFLNNTNQLIRPGTPYYNPRVVGSKTGWTHAAGNTLVTYAVHEGRSYIVTILQGSGTDPFLETTALLNYAFHLPYEERVVFNADSYMRVVPVYQEINGEQVEIYRLVLQADENLTAHLPVNFDLTQLRYSLSVPEDITAPISEGDPLGNVSVYVQNVYLSTITLRAQSTVKELPPSEAIAAANEPAPGVSTHSYEPYAAVHYPLPSGTFNLWEIFNDSDRLEALAVPLTVSFFGLILSVVLFATRRRRKMKQLFHIGSAGGTRYTNSYRYR